MRLANIYPLRRRGPTPASVDTASEDAAAACGIELALIRDLPASECLIPIQPAGCASRSTDNLYAVPTPASVALRQ